ncbi:ATP-binding cassette domain-containing protein [Chitinophaga pendula]|uniref:ABC transporter ATP-binding protein n=1 Tax=Chitinophaga TaxID=79328 RepID=UPI000BAFE700|nr:MULTISPECIES: ATP-binding cassette domain-containing protein [Chitinophaga]ASZ09759.1 multidrug ABC transporter ATP-binding protein [Chitinophaga sp. MD30]UCJ07301.1 ATP-binding cassette domain-containing protein [Chitinophaga pendula]
MTTPIISTQQLSFSYGNIQVLRDIQLEVPRGSIYGFLGVNGAGKTTLIRLLLGLLRQRGDHIRLFDQSLQTNRLPILSRIGSLIEMPSLYSHLNGYENLLSIALLRKVPKRRIDDVLSLVRLEKDAHRKVKEYSLGMKQRLSLALAMLSEPDLLILDEPTNGLDPNGIIEIRELLIRLNKEAGVTVFLSSHLLSEIEKLVTHVGILHKGQLMFQGTLSALQTLQAHRSTVQLKVGQPDLALALLQDVKDIVCLNGNHLQFPFLSEAHIAATVRQLTANDIDIFQVAIAQHDLENLFFQITENK